MEAVLGFKYRKHIFQTNEVVTSERVLENMRGLANEINGSLDRENLPISAISTNMVKDETFNTIIHTALASGITITGGGFKELTGMKVNKKLNTDALVISHFGGQFQWAAIAAELEPLMMTQGGRVGVAPLSAADAQAFRLRFDNDESKSVDNSTPSSVAGTDDYYELREIYANFEMRVNGSVIAKSENNSVFRKKFHVSLTGAVAVPSGDLNIQIYAVLRRNRNGKDEDLNGFNLTVTDRALVAEIKTR